MNATAQAIPAARRSPGTIRERMRSIKNAAIGAALGKSEDWARKVLDGDSGVLLDDIPKLLETLGLKVVNQEKICVHPEIARAYDVIVRRATAEHQLLWDDAE